MQIAGVTGRAATCGVAAVDGPAPLQKQRVKVGQPGIPPVVLRAAADIDPYNRHLHQRALNAMTGLADPGTDGLDRQFESRVAAGGLPSTPDPTRDP